LGAGRKADDFSLQKKIVVAKFKEVKIGSNLAESSKGGHGSKLAVLPMMIMMITNSMLMPSNDGVEVNNELEKLRKLVGLFNNVVSDSTLASDAMMSSEWAR
jgi:hypothetical protein